MEINFYIFFLIILFILIIIAIIKFIIRIPEADSIGVTVQLYKILIKLKATFPKKEAKKTSTDEIKTTFQTKPTIANSIIEAFQRYFNNGIIFMRQGKFKEAIKELEYADQMLPGNYSIYALLGFLYSTAVDDKRAIYYSEKAIGLKPEKFSPRFNLAVAKNHTSGSSESLPLYLKAEKCANKEGMGDTAERGKLNLFIADDYKKMKEYRIAKERFGIAISILEKIDTKEARFWLKRARDLLKELDALEENNAQYQRVQTEKEMSLVDKGIILLKNNKPIAIFIIIGLILIFIANVLGAFQKIADFFYREKTIVECPQRGSKGGVNNNNRSQNDIQKNIRDAKIQINRLLEDADKWLKKLKEDDKENIRKINQDYYARGFNGWPIKPHIERVNNFIKTINDYKRELDRKIEDILMCIGGEEKFENIDWLKDEHQKYLKSVKICEDAKGEAKQKNDEKFSNEQTFNIIKGQNPYIE